MKDTVLSFNVHEDTHHAWIEVSLAQIIQLGLENSISPFSYVCESTNRVFLERDFDAATLFDECRRRGLQYTVNKEFEKKTVSSIRSLPHFQTSAIRILKAYREEGGAFS